MAVTPDELTAESVWARINERARRELSDGPYNMWFAGIRPGRLADGVLELLTPSDYVRDWLVRHYMQLIQGAARDAVGEPIRVHIAVDRTLPRTEAAGSEEEPPPPRRPAGQAITPATPFPERYTFDTFVPGPSNRFAHAASMAVAEAPPSRAYNPLFIHGGVGLGKTHLLYAIGQHMKRLTPSMRCMYVTSEQFVTEFIKAVRERQGYQFQRRYRDVDVLLVDDVQFLARAEETQTEFFHTFNALHGAERQIVIASDRPPQELSGMEERLRSRFRWGLCVDVLPPDLETRIAILQLKATRDGIEVPDDVLDAIASKFEQNIRELEGALLRVVAFASLLHQPITAEIAEQALRDLIPASGADIPAETILELTAAYFRLARADLVGKSRSRPLTTARHIAMYLLRECTGLSLLKIGELMNRDHTTVLHGTQKVGKMMGERGSTYQQVQELTRKIRTAGRN